VSNRFCHRLEYCLEPLKFEPTAVFAALTPFVCDKGTLLAKLESISDEEARRLLHERNERSGNTDDHE
jgi:hypothetical protein